MNPNDLVIFSADPIPGNETSVYSLIDDIARIGARVIYSEVSDAFHVSGHASSEDLMLMMNLVSPRMVLPIGGTYRQMVQYRNLAEKQGFERKNILLLEDGQEVVFTKDNARLGNKINLEMVYVDQISGGEVESFVLRDRQKLATDGIVVILSEINLNGQIDNLDIIVKGLSNQEINDIQRSLASELKVQISQRKGTNDRFLARKFITEISEKFIFQKIHKRPLILPVVIEV